jgi:hypothetical protein
MSFIDDFEAGIADLVFSEEAFSIGKALHIWAHTRLDSKQI